MSEARSAWDGASVESEEKWREIRSWAECFRGTPAAESWSFIFAEFDRLRTEVRAAVAFEVLRRRGVITADPAEQAECCGIPRDDDGFCVHRPGHPIAVSR